MLIAHGVDPINELTVEIDRLLHKRLKGKFGAQSVGTASAVRTVIFVACQRFLAVGTDAEQSNGVTPAAFEFGGAEGGVGASVDELAEWRWVLVHIKYYELSIMKYRSCSKNK